MRIVYRRSDAARWFSAFVPLIPILQYYVSPIGAFNAATFLAVCFLALFILNFIFFSRGRVLLNLNLLPAFVYLFYMTLNVIVTGWYYSYPISWGVTFAIHMASYLIASRKKLNPAAAV